MSVLIEFRMASFGVGHGVPSLSPEGRALAVRVGRHQIRDRFTHAVSASAMPCTQTLKAMLEGACIPRLPPPVFFPIGTTVPIPETLHKACAQADIAHIPRFTTCLAGAPEDTRRFAAALACLVQAYGCMAAPGDKLLAVTCSPFLELIVMGLVGPIMWPFKPCAGVQVALDGRDAQLVYTGPHLDPETILSEDVP